MPSVLAALLLASGLVPLGASAAESSQPVAFQLRSLDGGQFVPATALRGRATVLLFWSADCPACRRELAALHALHAAATPLDVVVVALDDARALPRALGTAPPPVRLLRGPADSRALLRRLGNRAGALPFSVALDADGRICAAALGELAPATLGAWPERCVVGAAGT